MALKNSYEQLFAEITTPPIVNPPTGEPYGKHGAENITTFGQRGQKWLTGQVGDARFQNTKRYYLNIQGFFSNQDPEEALQNFLAYIEQLKSKGAGTSFTSTTPTTEATVPEEVPVQPPAIKDAAQVAQEYIKESGIVKGREFPYINKKERAARDYFLSGKKQLEQKIGEEAKKKGWFTEHVIENWPNWENKQEGDVRDPDEVLRIGGDSEWRLSDVKRIILPLIEDENNTNVLNKMQVVATAGDPIPTDIDWAKSGIKDTTVIEKIKKDGKVPTGYIVIKYLVPPVQQELPMKDEWSPSDPSQRFKEGFSSFEKSVYSILEARKTPPVKPYMIMPITRKDANNWVYVIGPKAGQYVPQDKFKTEPVQAEPAEGTEDVIDKEQESPKCQPFNADGTIHDLVCWLNVIANRMTIGTRNGTGVSPYNIVETYLSGTGLQVNDDSRFRHYNRYQEGNSNFENIVNDIITEAPQPPPPNPIPHKAPAGYGLYGEPGRGRTWITRKGEGAGLKPVTTQQVLNFHEAMITYFIKPGVLLYLTQEEWNNLKSVVGRIWGGIKQIANIGAGVPRPTL